MNGRLLLAVLAALALPQWAGAENPRLLEIR